MGRSSRDKRDMYYRLAKEDGWRARSAYKLLQLDAEFQFLSDVSRVVDLCAAPGGWSQVLAQKVRTSDQSAILAIDLQKMADIPGVIAIQDDITSQSAVEKVLHHFSGHRSDLVVCDGAPDVIGRHDFDEFIQDQLLLAALRISVQILKPGGHFVAKIFRGKEVSLMATHLAAFFENVTMAKPRCCRTSSIESFVYCQGFRAPCDITTFQDLIDSQVKEHFVKINDDSARKTIPFVSCKTGALYDPDMNYSLQVGTGQYVYREPTQKPIDPPYKTACGFKKLGKIHVDCEKRFKVVEEFDSAKISNHYKLNVLGVDVLSFKSKPVLALMKEIEDSGDEDGLASEIASLDWEKWWADRGEPLLEALKQNPYFVAAVCFVVALARGLRVPAPTEQVDVQSVVDGIVAFRASEDSATKRRLEELMSQVDRVTQNQDVIASAFARVICILRGNESLQPDDEEVGSE